MNINKYALDYSEIISKNKPIFVFVNHKTALICWAEIGKRTGKQPDVITFDSHADFRHGLILGEPPYNREHCFGSKNLVHLKHFTEYEEFMNWSISDNKQTTGLVKQEKKFLTAENDNFIDVAIIKNIISDVYWYFFNPLPQQRESEKCEDVSGEDHSFNVMSIKKFDMPSSPFILDIDLDFFVKSEGLLSSKFSMVSDLTIKKYLDLQKKLFLSNFCVGLTIALEPYYCGGRDNCLYLLKKLCDEFQIDLVSKSKRLIKMASRDE